MNKRLNVIPIIRAAIETVKSHELERGTYCRWLWQNEKNDRELGINEYGCADAMNILYTVNEFDCDEQTRNLRVSALLSLQDSETGMFTEATHHPIHTTAHCLGALQLFDVKPRYKLTGLYPYMTKDGLYSLLDGLNWNDPWPESHKGAGIYAALVNSGEITEDFSNNYFKWMWENANADTGFWKNGYTEKSPLTSIRYPNGKNSPDAAYSYMAGGFHYLFNHEYAKMPIRYPEKIIDSCIEMYYGDGLPKNFGKAINFIEVDLVYCLTRASRKTTHRRSEVVALLEDFAEKYVDYLLSLDYSTHDGFNDLHMLFGSLSALAELQAALPDKIITEKPLRLVLDRRPFI
ncbi:MAG: hypothetical protein E7673_04480 [Ruminococcaceae bacterium]|nr:hypothetical protein [Oscillospiraceae bacterium]